MDTPCEIWPGRCKDDGYGVLRIDGKEHRVHRVVWELANGPIPTGLLICHRCDNPPCFNLDHLFVGTVADNNHDALKKGRRMGFGKHTANPKAVLTKEQVQQIRQACAAHPRERHLIAQEYGIARTTVNDIVWGITWKE